MNNPSHSQFLDNPSAAAATKPHDTAADRQLTRILEKYLADLEAGCPPSREELLANHCEFAGMLADCLDGLEFVHRVAPQWRDDSSGNQSKVSPQSPIALGDFRILREIGRGGMGVVYEAEQLSLNRRVALKVLPFAAILDKRQLQRFHNEARAAATLEHPGIVSIYSVGCEHGVHYYAMQFIEGKTLAEVIRELRVGGSLRDPQAPSLGARGVARPESSKGVASTGTDFGGGAHENLPFPTSLERAAQNLPSPALRGGVAQNLPSPISLERAAQNLPSPVFGGGAGGGGLDPGIGIASPGPPSQITRDLASGSFPSRKQSSTSDDPTTPYSHPAPDAQPASASAEMPSAAQDRSTGRTARTRGTARTTASAETPRELHAGISTDRSTKSPEFFRSVANLGIQAAEALDHAHERGVLHRDIKPGNLLLDTEGRVFVTDFGLARIEADPSMTITGDIVGTLRYMSPEQALAKRAVVDHRADIYSLGVTLYELLTLEPAFQGDDRQELFKQIAFEEPTLPRRLNRSIPLDLETIILKAMRKNPNERYDTAQELADDLKRFVEDKPIQARRPTLRQRIVKWSRRHRAVVVAAALLLVVVTIASLISSAMILQEQRRTEEALARAQAQEQLARENAAAAKRNADTAERAAAESNAVVDFLVNDMIGAAEPEAKMGKEITVDEVLSRAEKKVAMALKDQPLLETAIQQTIGKTFFALGRYEKAKHHLSKAREGRLRLLGPDHPETLRSMMFLANSLERLGDYWNAFKLREETLDRMRRALGPEHRDTLRTAMGLANSLSALGDRDNARTLREETLEKMRRVLGPEDLFTLRAMHNLANSLVQCGERENARKLREETLELKRRVLGPEHPDTLATLNCLTVSLAQCGEHENARKLREELLEIQRRILGPEHPDTLCTMNNLAFSLVKLGKTEDAQKLYDETLQISQRVLGPEHPFTLMLKGNLAISDSNMGEHEKARRLFEETLEMQRRILGKQHPATLRTMKNLATLLWELGEYEETLEMQRRILGPEHPDTRFTLSLWYYRVGEYQRAMEVLRPSINQENGAGNHPWNFFLLSMAHWRLGHADDARSWYARAVEWMAQHDPEEAELKQLRDEAIALGRPRLVEPQQRSSPYLVNDERRIAVQTSLPKLQMAIGSPADEIDDASVTSAVVQLSRDGRELHEASDFTFHYQPNSDLIELEASAGSFSDGTYQISLGSGESAIGYRSGSKVPASEFFVQVDSALPAPETLAFGVELDGNHGFRRRVQREPAIMIPKGAMWKYLADRSDPGTTWRETTFDDSGWKAGPAQLGYGDKDEATLVGNGTDKDGKFIVTYYFRHTFEVADANTIHGLVLHLLRDDGAIIYLNGKEVVRDNLAQNAVQGDFAWEVVDGIEESTFVKFPLDPKLLVKGTNCLAVQLHQRGPSSSDISLDLQLTAAGSGLLRFDELLGNGAGRIPPGSIVRRAELSLVPPAASDSASPVAGRSSAVAGLLTEPQAGPQVSEPSGPATGSNPDFQQPSEDSPDSKQTEFKHPPLTSSLKLYRMPAPWSQDNGESVIAGMDAALQGSEQVGICGKFDVTADVQAWADGQPNYGWAIVQSSAAFEFPLSAAGEGESGPQLTVHFIPADKVADLAWFLANCPDATFRDPARAVEMAQRAVKFSPAASRPLLVLGVALYRADRCEEAVAALRKSLELGTDEQTIARLFLAMAHWKLGHAEEARRVYEEAVQGMDEHADVDEDVKRLRAEAAELLGVGARAADAQSDATHASQRP